MHRLRAAPGVDQGFWRRVTPKLIPQANHDFVVLQVKPRFLFERARRRPLPLPVPVAEPAMVQATGVDDVFDGLIGDLTNLGVDRSRPSPRSPRVGQDRAAIGVSFQKI